MFTLIISGSARADGYTQGLIDSFLENAVDEVKIIDAYTTENIKPCVDCRYCYSVLGCSINDGMQEVYNDINRADVIVLASPMYFFSVTGVMKIILDRLQPYWAGTIRGDHDTYKKKQGVKLMVGGARSFENQFLAGEMVLNSVLRDINASCDYSVAMPGTDKITQTEAAEYYSIARDISKKVYSAE